MKKWLYLVSFFYSFCVNATPAHDMDYIPNATQYSPHSSDKNNSNNFGRFEFNSSATRDTINLGLTPTWAIGKYETPVYLEKNPKKLKPSINDELFKLNDKFKKYSSPDYSSNL